MMRLSMPVLLVTVLLVAGCNQLPEVPPIASPPSESHRAGQFVWYDLVTHNPDQATKFYGALLGWEFEPAGGDDLYTVATYEGKPVAGFINARKSKRAGEVHPQWLSYVSVDDVDAAMQVAVSQGGVVDIEAFDLPQRGRVATMFDNRRALVALVTSSSGDPPRAEPVLNTWLWTELWTDDPAASGGFYKTLVGYEHNDIDLAALGTYTIFKKSDERLSGMVRIPDERITPNWLPYIAVGDPAEVEARVVDLGGRVLVGAEQVSNGRAAILADPSGAAFGVHRWPIDLENYPEKTE